MLLGWREWVSLPALGVGSIKAKIDTGARSSALHAFDLELDQRKGKTFARFRIHPLQSGPGPAIKARAEVAEFRKVKSSSGHATLRPVILTQLEVSGTRWPIELTLANRDEMGFRLLLGRQALRGQAVVDPSRSFVAGRPPQQGKASGKELSPDERLRGGRASG